MLGTFAWVSAIAVGILQLLVAWVVEASRGLFSAADVYALVLYTFLAALLALFGGLWGHIPGGILLLAAAVLAVRGAGFLGVPTAILMVGGGIYAFLEVYQARHRPGPAGGEREFWAIPPWLTSRVGEQAHVVSYILSSEGRSGRRGWFRERGSDEEEF